MQKTTGAKEEELTVKEKLEGNRWWKQNKRKKKKKG